jgi:methanogenic corrinoid protein MtbC1
MLEVSAELLRARSRLGAWWSVAQEVGSALNELGALWVEKKISVLEGHTAAELLGRSLAWCSQTIPVSPSAPTALLVTAEGDDHTLGLSLAELVCREAGWSTCWAGRRTPTRDVQARIAGGAIQMVLVSASSASTDEALLREQAEALGSAARPAGVRLVLGGRGPWPEEQTYGDRLDSFEELSRLLRDPHDALVRQHLL